MGIKLALKKMIIAKNMSNKKKKVPADFEQSELYQLPSDAPAYDNNSYFFGGYSCENKQALVMRLGIRSTGVREVFVFYRTKDFLLINGQDYYTEKNNPLHVKCLEPSKKWQVDFNGYLIDQKTNQKHKVKFSFVWIAKREIFDFYYSMQNPYMISSVANCKWNKDFKEQMAGNTQRHYEQTGYLDGIISIDKEEQVLSMSAGRDHSFGKRVWDEMDEHIWLFAFNNKGEIFNYSMVDYPLLKNIQCGWTDKGRNKIVHMIHNDFECYKFNDGLGGDLMKLKMKMSDGELLNVELNRVDNQRTEYDNGSFYFQEGFATFNINGEEFFGSLEYGFNRNKSRWNKEREV